VPADIDIVTLDSAPGLLLGALSATGQIESSDSLTRTLAINILRGQIAQSVPPDAQITAADIDAAASQQAAMMIDGMIQQGLIQRKNGQLNMDFSYADGQLFVNNVPIPFGQP
jgi:cytochrome c-type biogenesis protein CcmE